MIELDFIKCFDDFELSIQAQIPSKGITAIFGRSGAGKTSLINAISGVVKPDSGRITLDEQCLFDSTKAIHKPIHKRKIGYVFQEARLFPHYKVLGNLLYGSQLTKHDKAFQEIVELLALSDLLQRHPLELSGGEKQRCAIARALLSQPDMLLMDEPLASLDLPRKQEIMPYLEKLANEVQCPILYVTHSLDEVLRLADHLMIIESGKVKTVDKLENLWRSHELLPWHGEGQQSSLILARLEKHHPSYALSCLKITENIHIWMSKLEQPIDKLLRLRIFASDISISLSRARDSSIRNILAAQIINVTFPNHENSSQVHLDLDLLEHNQVTGVQLRAEITQWSFDELDLKVGQKVYAQIKSVSMTNKDTGNQSI